MLICRTLTNSIIVSVRLSISFFWSIYTAFCKETTLHGLKHTVAANFHFLERLIWFILTLGAFAGAVYCGLNQLSRYNSEPVVVSLQRDYRSWWTVVPAVTTCFYQRVDEDKAKEVIFKLWNVTEENPEKYKYYYGFVELIADVSFRTNLQNFWKYQNDGTVDNIDLLQLALDVHPNLELNVTLSDPTKEVKWVPVMTEEGLCMTFNSEYAEFQLTPGIEWKKPQLLKCHYHSPECFVRIESLDNAVRIFVHSPFDIATAISNPTGEIMPGDELVTTFKAVEIQAASRVKSLRPEQRRCKYPDEWISSSIKAYSFGLCQMNCRSRMAVMFCGCRPYFIVKGDGDVCDSSGMACIGRNVEILINLPKNLAKCSCLPQCTEINYYSHTKKNVIRLTKQNKRTIENMFITIISLLFNAFYYVISFIFCFISYLHAVLPFGIDVGVLGIAAYYMTKLKKPDPENVYNIFGPEPGTKESELHPERVVKCIAHRGAGLDAPENTLHAFKYCVERDCNFIELDVRTSKDGRLVLLHDQGLERLTGTDIPDVHIMDWDSIKHIDVGATHPNRQQFKEARLCLLEDAVDYLLANNTKMIIDVKGEDQEVVNGILKAFTTQPVLYKYAVVTSFNPFVLYKIRNRDPQIVGAISYRPYCFSAASYDAENGPTNPRSGNRIALHAVLRVADVLHSLLWRFTARWCNVSAVLLHKDIVSPSEVEYWRSLGVRCAGWCVNRPLEKLYWRAVLRAPYLANTLLGEPEVEQKKVHRRSMTDLPDKLTESERRLSSGQN
ncbi:uncharacterized protein [Epargyreus clarus]|uniref:uncharacterized protein n=1 Tax=Epargyreus clarus TaxID=520877 RepID=UPI003C2BC473